MPGLGQGHGKKRHLHAHSPVNFKELKCYQNHNFKKGQESLSMGYSRHAYSARLSQLNV
jgi:hypothetical protein